MAMTIERTGVFSAASEHGDIYTIIEFTNVDRWHSSEGNGCVEGPKFYETSDSQHAKRTPDGKFQLSCGTKLTSI